MLNARFIRCTGYKKVNLGSDLLPENSASLNSSLNNQTPAEFIRSLQTGPDL
jgi:hypothetical protein